MIFLHHDVIYLMLIPTILLIYLIATNKSEINRIFDKDTLEQLKLKSDSLTKNMRNALFFTALIFMILALARPVVLKDEIEIKAKGSDIVIALDISKSMIAKDIYPNRLEFAKRKIQEFIKLNKKNKIALIAFANQSFIVAPLTNDSETIEFLLKNLSTKSLNLKGTSLISSLQSVDKILNKSDDKNLVLFTDGSDSKNFEKEIDFAKENDIKIYIVNIGTEKGAPMQENQSFIKDKNGNIVITKLNESIKELAFATSGAYIKASIANSDIELISKEIENQAKIKEFGSKKIKDYTELFYYPLIFAVTILLFAFSSIPKRFFIFLILFVNLNETKASILDFDTINKANESYKIGEYSEAKSYFEEVSNEKNSNEAFYNLANAKYKEGKYKDAIESYSEIVTKDKNLEFAKLYNIANSYVKTDNLEKAKEFYENSLKIKDDSDAKHNLEVVQKALEKKKQNNQEQKNQDSEKENQNRDDKKQQKENEQNQKEQKDSEKENQKQENSDQKNQNKKQDSDKENQNSKNADEKNNQEQKEQQRQNEKEKLEDNKDENRIPIEKNLSDLEEKKWLEFLDNKSNKTLLYSNQPKDKNVENNW